MKPYSVEWKREPEDAFMLIKNSRSSIIQATIWSVVIALLVLLVVSFYEQLTIPIQALIFLFVSIGGFFIWFMMNKWVGELLVKLGKASMPISIITIDDNGIRGENEGGFFQLNWGKIQEVRELKDYIRIRTKKEMLLLPKRCFENAEEVREVIAFMETSIQ